MKRVQVSPLWEALALGGGSLFFAMLAYFFEGSINVAWVVSAAAVLSWVINYPHFAATEFRLYQSRHHAGQFPWIAFGMPALLVGVVAFGIQNSLFASFWIKLFSIWSPFHYAGQSYGIALLYWMRSGTSLSEFERRIWKGTCLLIFLVSFVGAETGHGYQNTLGLPVLQLGIPLRTLSLLKAALIFCSGILVFYFFKNYHDRKRMWIAYLPIVSFGVWFLWGPRLPGFFPLVPLFHSIQYLWIAGGLEWAEKSGDSSSHWKTMCLWTVVIVAGGAILFEVLPFLGRSYLSSAAPPLILATVQIHHFFVDGVIWRIQRDGSLR